MGVGKMSKIGNYVVGLQESAMVPCPDCDGDGLMTVEVPKPQSFSRDIGELYEELQQCDLCNGLGEIEREDEDE
tara:strand:+ start:414 stop:635 length:222 start_codon:yes stop_codon:yes gene_type:complete